MEKILLTTEKVNIYHIKGEKDGKEYDFISYEMVLPNGTRVNLEKSKKTSEITNINLYSYIGKLKADLEEE